MARVLIFLCLFKHNYSYQTFSVKFFNNMRKIMQNRSIIVKYCIKPSFWNENTSNQTMISGFFIKKKKIEQNDV